MANYCHLSYEDRKNIEDGLNGNCPYQAMLFLCDEYILKILNCYYIKPDEINLTDDLLD